MKTLEELKESLVEIIDSEIKKYEQEQAKQSFKVGDWVKYTPSNYWMDGHPTKVFRIKKFSDGYLYIQPDAFNPETNANNIIKYFTKATPTEIHEALKKEAVKKGFEVGVTVDKSKLDYDYHQKVWTIHSNETHYDRSSDELVMGSDLIYQKGIWATVQKEQPLMIGGKYEVKFHSSGNHPAMVGGDCYEAHATIDGYTFTKSFWQAAKLISEHSKAKIMIGCSKQFDVSLELINQILEKLK